MMKECVAGRMRGVGRRSRNGLGAWGRWVLLLLLWIPSAAQGLEEGDRAPDFLLSGSDGELYSLQGLLEENSGVVLAFFPRAFTPA